MKYDKVVNSVQLDGAMTATADAIRMKNGGGTGEIVWDTDRGFEAAIKTIESGGGNTLVWDGDISGRRVVKDPKVGIINYYRISGEIPTPADLIEGIVYYQRFEDGRTATISSFEKIEIGGDLNYLTVTEHQDVLHINLVTEGAFKNVQPYYIIANKNNAYDSGLNVTFPESGIYIIYFGSESVVIENPVRKLTIYGYDKFTAVIPPMEEIVITPSTTEQIITPQEGYQGFLSVKVEAAETPGNAIKWDGNREGMTPYNGVYYHVSDIILPADMIQNSCIFTSVDGATVIFAVSNIITINENSYVFMLKWNNEYIPAVNVISKEYTDDNGEVWPVGTYFLCLTSEDTEMFVSGFAIREYKGLPHTLPILHTKFLTSAESKYIMPDEGFDGMNLIVIEKGGTLVPENIRDGVTIFGVTGTYTGE